MMQELYNVQDKVANVVIYAHSPNERLSRLILE